MNTRAGDGDNHRFIIKENDATPSSIQAGVDYIAVDAVSWFVNRQGNFFVDRMVAGSLEFRIHAQDYSTVLGNYILEGGQRTAPIFDRPIVPIVAYHGGDLTLKAFIKGIKQNTAAGTLMKQMAAASLTVVTGAIQVGTGGIATTALIAAGTILGNGAVNMLTANDEKAIPIFNPFEVTVKAAQDVTTLNTYILLHRGSNDVDEKLLTVSISAAGTKVKYNGQFFNDGAWILFRISKSATYTGDPRPWKNEVESVKNKIENLIDLWDANAITKDNVISALTPTGQEPTNVGDSYFASKERIKEDLVLTRKDRITEAGLLRAYYDAAKDAANSNDPQSFYKWRDGTLKALVAGTIPPGFIATIFREESEAIAPTEDSDTLGAHFFKGDTLWKTLKYQ